MFWSLRSWNNTRLAFRACLVVVDGNISMVIYNNPKKTRNQEKVNKKRRSIGRTKALPEAYSQKQWKAKVQGSRSILAKT